LRGISTEMFLRLCWRAPRTEIFVIGIRKYASGATRDSTHGDVDNSLETSDSVADTSTQVS
jgi:hypothetical protein